MKDELAQRFLSGRELYGDDFTPDQIRAWYEAEKDDYGDRVPAARQREYTYHRLNWRDGFRYLPRRQYEHVLAFGGASGDELRPVARSARRITIIEPSDEFRVSDIDGVPVAFVKPAVDGTLAQPEGTFDLITCFSVLHHVPNVTHVLSELSRCLMQGGYMLLREPITSMGAWKSSRPDPSVSERGLPLGYLRRTLRRCGLEVLHESLCSFPATYPVMRAVLRGQTPNSHFLMELDALLCWLFAWNLRYHATTRFQKLRPGAVFYVLRKQRMSPDRPNGE